MKRLYMSKNKIGAAAVIVLMAIGIIALGLFAKADAKAVILNDEDKITYNEEVYIPVSSIPDDAEAVEYFDAKSDNESFFDKVNSSYKCTLYKSADGEKYIAVVKYVEDAPLNSLDPYCYKAE
ncbi:MAG: hypothetical protein NC397_07775 [Clostridium sp.]|nr:hypothetical protein [Clostridium sp.]